MSFFRHTNAGGISVVIPPGNEPRDPRTGRLLKDLTAGQLAIVYERNPELRKLAIEPYDQRKLTQPELRGTWNGSPIVDVVQEGAGKRFVAGSVASPQGADQTGCGDATPRQRTRNRRRMARSISRRSRSLLRPAGFKHDNHP
jgi:hypothetical protein